MKNFIRFLVIATILFISWLAIEFCLPIGAFAEEMPQTYPMYVNIRLLNGREKPTTNSSREACFEKGDIVRAVELNNIGWVLVEGGETDVVWCKAEYLSDSPVVRKWKNASGGSVNLRKNPSYEAKCIGRIKAGRIVRITAEVFGWGYIKDKGWVDLEYFELVETDE